MADEIKDDLFTMEDTLPEEDWVKWDVIGKTEQGILVDEPQYNVVGKFGLQNIYTIETAEGKIKMIGLNPKTHVRAVRQLKQAEVGDVIAIRYESDYDSGKGNPGKNIVVRIKHLPKTGGETNG